MTKEKAPLPPFEYPQGYRLIAGVDEVETVGDGWRQGVIGGD